MPESTATLPNSGASNYTPSTPPAIANPQSNLTPIIPPVVIPSTTSTPEPAPITQPTQVTNAPDLTIDFDAFSSAKGDIVPPKVTTPPSTTTAQPAPTTQQTNQPTAVTNPPTTPVTTPAAPAITPVATPSTTPGLDKDGNPLVPTLEIDLSKSAFGVPQTTQQANPQTQQTTVTQPVLENGRDLTGFDEAEKKLFRQMSNDAFNHIAPIVRANKQLQPQLQNIQQENSTLKQQLQTRSLDPLTAANPHGYVFTPEFAHITQGQQNAQFEQRYWQDQLATLRTGKKPRQLMYQDTQNGRQYLTGQEMEPDANAEALIQNNMIQANQLVGQWGQASNALRLGFQQQVSQDLSAIKQAEDQYFPWFAEGKQHPYQPLIDSFIQKFPPTQRANPLAKAMGKAYALITHLQNELSRVKTTAAAPPTVVQNPIGITSTPSSPASTNGEITIDAFEAAKQQI